MQTVKIETAAIELGKTAETVRIMMANDEFKPAIGEVKSKDKRGRPLKRKSYWVYREWLDQYKKGIGNAI